MLKEGENDAGENTFDDDRDSGHVPTTLPKSDLCLLLCAGKNRTRLNKNIGAKEPAQQREI